MTRHWSGPYKCLSTKRVSVAPPPPPQSSSSLLDIIKSETLEDSRAQ